MNILEKLNANLADLPVYQPGRPMDEVARELGIDPSSIIKLASNENPLGPSPAAVEAMKAAADQMHLYPDGNCFHLKRKLAEKLGVETGNVIFGNGSNEIIEFIGHAFLREGTNIVVSEYCFAIYPIVARLFGADVKTVPAENHGHDLDGMLASIDDDTQVVFVANPNNPTGTLADRETVERFVQAVPGHVLLVMDEAYFEFLDDPVDLLPLIKEGKKNLLVMRTFSKIYGLAGLRIGYGVAVPELISAMEKIRQPFNINAMAQAGALAALSDESHLEATRSTNRAGLDYLEGAFEKMGLEYVKSYANFSLVKVGDGGGVFADLQKAGVITRPMAGYKLPEWVRISVGTQAENERCIDALGKSLSD